MSKIGIYPGSFDPITFGHLDIIQRSLNVVDTLIVAVSDNKSKNHFINIDDRLNLIEATIKNLSPEEQKKITQPTSRESSRARGRTPERMWRTTRGQSPRDPWHTSAQGFGQVAFIN